MSQQYANQRNEHTRQANKQNHAAHVFFCVCDETTITIELYRSMMSSIICRR